MTYKLYRNPLSNEIDKVIKTDVMFYIPFDPDNTDYQAYLAWLELGNEPLPAENT